VEHLAKEFYPVIPILEYDYVDETFVEFTILYLFDFLQ
jgi:hypothetical protein